MAEVARGHRYRIIDRVERRVWTKRRARWLAASLMVGATSDNIRAGWTKGKFGYVVFIQRVQYDEDDAATRERLLAQLGSLTEGP